MVNLVPNVKAFVYAASGAAPWLCSFGAKCRADPAEASFFLDCCVPVAGFADEQVFSLAVEASNLVAGANSLAAAKDVDDDASATLARHATPKLKTLTLTLKTPCTIFCPFAARTIQPMPGLEAAFHRFGELARSTRFRVVFDYQWIPKAAREQLKALIHRPEKWEGLRKSERNAKTSVALDWTVFSPSVLEVPPPYVEARSKRGELWCVVLDWIV